MRAIWREINFVRKNLFFFRTMNKKLRHFGTKVLRQGSQNWFYVSVRTFWGELFFLRNLCVSLSLSVLERKVSGLLANLFHQGFQNCLPRVHGKERKSVVLESLIFWINCGHWWKNFWTSVEIVPTGWSKLYSTCPQQHFEEQKCLRKKCTL